MKTLLIISMLLMCSGVAQAEEINVNKLVASIYKAEGGIHAKKPFGILSVKCTDYEACKRVCRNTVRHSYAKWKKSGSNEDFVEVLSRKYAPIGCENDNGSNINWSNLVRFFYEQR